MSYLTPESDNERFLVDYIELRIKHRDILKAFQNTPESKKHIRSRLSENLNKIEWEIQKIHHELLSILDKNS